MKRTPLKIAHRTLPDLEAILSGYTMKTQTLEDGRVQASSPNYPDLKPAIGTTAIQARQGFERRLRAYAASGANTEKANAADISPTSRDPLTCG